MQKDKTNRGQLTTQRPRRVSIELNVAVPSAVDGSVAQVWQIVAYATTIDWRSGASAVRYIADQPSPDDSAVIRIRYRTDLKPPLSPIQYRLSYLGRAMTINAVIDVADQHQYYDVHIKEAAT